MEKLEKNDWSAVRQKSSCERERKDPQDDRTACNDIRNGDGAILKHRGKGKYWR